MNKREIKKMVGKDVRKAINYLQSLFNEDDKVFNELIILESRLSQLFKSTREDTQKPEFIERGLNKISQSVLDFIDENSIDGTHSKEETPLEWLDRIPLTWENTLLAYYELGIPTRNKEVEYLWHKKSLNLDSDEIDTLEPITVFKKLKDITLRVPYVKDYTFLSTLEELEYIAISTSESIDFSTVFPDSIEELFLRDTEVVLTKDVRYSNLKEVSFNAIGFDLKEDIFKWHFDSINLLSFTSCFKIDFRFINGLEIEKLVIKNCLVENEGGLLRDISVKELSVTSDSSLLSVENKNYLADLDKLIIQKVKNNDFDVNFMFDNKVPADLKLINFEIEEIILLAKKTGFLKIELIKTMSEEGLNKLEKLLQNRDEYEYSIQEIKIKGYMLIIPPVNKTSHKRYTIVLKNKNSPNFA